MPGLSNQAILCLSPIPIVKSGSSRPRLLSQSPQLIHGPIAEHRFTVDKTFLHRPKVAAVVRHAAVVAENKKRIGRNNFFGIGAFIFVGCWYIIFTETLAVHIYPTVINADVVASHPNHPFYIALRRIARIAKYHDVTPLNRLQAVHKLIDEDALLVLEARHHAGALYLHGLIEKNNDER